MVVHMNCNMNSYDIAIMIWVSVSTLHVYRSRQTQVHQNGKPFVLWGSLWVTRSPRLKHIMDTLYSRQNSKIYYKTYQILNTFMLLQICLQNPISCPCFTPCAVFPVFWLHIGWHHKRISTRWYFVKHDGGNGRIQLHLWTHMDELMQERRISNALAMEQCLSCIDSWMYTHWK